MRTKIQEELVNSFLSALGDEVRPLYAELMSELDELGYHPKKENSNISFKHDLHNKQIAKMGVKVNKQRGSKRGSTPFFSLRFSACRGYSKRFADVIGAYMTKYPTRASRCTSEECNYCAGEADTHVYTYTFEGDESKTHCGAYAIEIPNLTADDMTEIKKLIKEEHDYLMKYEADIAVI